MTDLEQTEPDTADVGAPRRPPRPDVHLFDWCEPWRPESQHKKCPGSARAPGRPASVCECPTCQHPAAQS